MAKPPAKISGKSYNIDNKTFNIPGLGSENYWVKVQEQEPHYIELWNQNVGVGADARVGVIDPKDPSNITFNTGFNGATADEIRTLRMTNLDGQNARNSIINSSRTVVMTDKVKECGANEECIAKASRETEKIVNKNNAGLGQGVDSDTIQASNLPDTGTNKGGTRTKFGNLVYPASIRTSRQDIIKFQMLEFRPRKFKNGGLSEGKLGAFEEDTRMGVAYKDRKTIGSVALPIPGGIADSNRVEWGQDTMNPFQAQVANLAMTTLNKGFSGAFKQIQSATEGITKENKSLRNALKNFIAGEAAGVQNLLTRTTGAIINPNMELLFKAPSLRPFTFTFTLSPRDNQEGREILKIIRFFKQGMAPIRSSNQLFLKSPHTFRIKYISGGSRSSQEQKGLNTFKECALQAFGVEYTPEGNYSTYEDGVMTSYQINMQFQELEPIFNDDYGTEDKAEVGF